LCVVFAFNGESVAESNSKIV